MLAAERRLPERDAQTFVGKMATAIQKMQNGSTLTILQRIEGKDRSAIRDCLDAYGDFVWAIARRFTGSTSEAEAATEEIFRDIWQVSGKGCDSEPSEKKVIAMIALRRLAKRAGGISKHAAYKVLQGEQGGGADRRSGIL